MRDPYDPWADEHAAATNATADLAEARRRNAIEACTLCDPNGQRDDGLPCRHIDHAAAAHRGLAEIRRLMGWPNRDETRDEIDPAGGGIPDNPR